MAFSYLGALLERQDTVFVLEKDEALLENRVSFSGSFAAVCPEPVLANVRFSLYVHWRRADVFRSYLECRVHG
eukprot:COSAG06_NODE_3045_length_5921_cov_58.295259_1_plen_73_part_00